MTPEKIGRYTVSSLLGRGGFAVVYLASDPFVKRQVAIKVLPAQFADTEAMRARFQQEAEIIAALEHPAIVPIYDYGNHEGQPFIVMRYMAGGSLAERVGKGPMGIEQTAKILHRIGSALDRAHDQGIIHRDLKPGNILFDQYGEAYLSDFGIARLTEASLKLTGGGAIGTPAYMSPEQVYGDRPVDGRSDIYALGVILFEMLTGTIPYEADTPAKLMMKHVLEPVPRLLSVKPDLPPAYEDIMGRALAKEPEKRFSKASEFTSAVTLLSPTRPVQSSPAEQPVQPAPPPKSAPQVVEETMLETPTPPEVRRMAEPIQIGADSGPVISEGTKIAAPVRPTKTAADTSAGRPSWFRPGLFAAGAVVIIVFLAVVAIIGSNLLGGEETAESPTPSAADQTEDISSGIDSSLITTTVMSEILPEAEGVIAPRELANFHEIARLGRGFLTGLAVNPDGNILAAGSSIGVWLYDVDTLEPITLLEGHTAPVMDVDWSPDGRFLASASLDNTVKVWDIESGEVAHNLEGSHDMLMTVDWSFDGQFLASGGYDAVVRIYQADNGRLIQSLAGHEGPIRMVSWPPDNTDRIASASEDGSVKVWFVSSGEINFILHTDVLAEAVVWSNDGGRLFTGDDSGLLKVWDAANGELINEGMAHEYGLITMDLSPDGQLLATTGENGFVTIWNTDIEQEVTSWGGETSGPVTPAWLPDNDRLALSFEDNLLGVFQIDNPLAENMTRAHTGQIGSIAWTPEGRGLVSGHNAEDMTYLWSLETLERVGALPGFTADGKSISISADGSIFIRPKVGIEAFNLTSGLRSEMVPFFVGPEDSYVNVAELSPEADRIAAVNYEGTIRVWNLANQNLIFETGGAGAAAVAWSPDGRFIATPGDGEPIMIIWDSESGEWVDSFEYGSNANITGLDWSPDGRFLAAVDTEGILRLWDSESWGLSLSFQSFGTSLNSLDWSPDGRWLAAGSWSGSIYVWDATGESGQDPVLYIDLAHLGPIIAIAWSPDSTRLASGSHDGTVRIWGDG